MIFTLGVLGVFTILGGLIRGVIVLFGGLILGALTLSGTSSSVPSSSLWGLCDDDAEVEAARASAGAVGWARYW